MKAGRRVDNDGVQCPEDWDLDRCDKLSWQMADRYTATPVRDGISIVVLVIEPADRVRRDNEAFARNRLESALTVSTTMLSDVPALYPQGSRKDAH